LVANRLVQAMQCRAQVLTGLLLGGVWIERRCQVGASERLLWFQGQVSQQQQGIVYREFGWLAPWQDDLGRA
jgi:hypothetical protein